MLDDPLETIAPCVLTVAALAAAAHLPRLNRLLQGAVVAAGLQGASVGLVALWHGATAAWSHPFLVLALLMLYEDASLLLLAVAVVAGTHILSDRAGGRARSRRRRRARRRRRDRRRPLNGSLRDVARQATQRFRSSFDSMPIGMVIVAPQEASTARGARSSVTARCEIVGHRCEIVG